MSYRKKKNRPPTQQERGVVIFLKKWYLVILFALGLLILPYSILRERYIREETHERGLTANGTIYEKYYDTQVRISYRVDDETRKIKIRVPKGIDYVRVGAPVVVKYIPRHPYHCVVYFDPEHSMVH